MGVISDSCHAQCGKCQLNSIDDRERGKRLPVFHCSNLHFSVGDRGRGAWVAFWNETHTTSASRQHKLRMRIP